MKKLILATLLSVAYTLTAYAQTNLHNQVLVYFKTGAQRIAPSNTTANITSANILNVLTNYGIPTSNVVPSFPGFNEADIVNPELGEISRQMNRAKVFTITVTNPATKNSFIAALNGLSEVLYAETNGTASNNAIPIDGGFGQQWGMRNTIVPGADIHAEQAWDIFTGNPNAIIAIIDMGVDVNHDDLNTKIVGGDNNFEIGENFLNLPMSHGSHVAGIAAAITNNNNNVGVAGVDWRARIHPKNIFDGNGDLDIAQSIIDAVNFSSNVWTLNNSWGNTFENDVPGRYSITVRHAFAYAYRNNRVSCIAMGNDQLLFPNVVAFPAGFNSGIIAVGATNFNDNIAGFSSNGPHVDVSAPGVGIWSTNFNNGYIEDNGTSMASPHVAGLASLLKGFNTNLANDDIEQIIRLSADDRGVPGFDNAFGTGRINALRALQFLQAPNTVQHLNVTGGTVVNTSGNMNRIFLGVPGLPDAAYNVRRSEVQTNVTFPAMCNIIGVWGRGIGTTGYREENGRNFGEGICEVVPGTLTNTTATLRTWIYEVWTMTGQYLGFYPRTANNVVFQYSILGVPRPTTINGDANFCATSNNYTIPNFPAGATVQWQASPAGIVTINSPNSPQTTITKNTDGIITLTAIISNSCGGGSITLSKQNITVGFPYFSIPIDGPDIAAPNGQYYFTQMLPSNYPPATYNWQVSSGWQILNNQGNPIVFIQAGNTGGFIDVGVTACGLTRMNSKYVEVGPGGWDPARVTPEDNKSPYSLKATPNPASGNVTLTLVSTNSKSKDNSYYIQEVRISDKMGNIKKQLKFGDRQLSQTINIADLSKDNYVASVYDGHSWQTVKIMVR